VRLSKHHGLGNDFLVLLDQGEASGELARRLCDRRRGIGADGLISGCSGLAGVGSDADVTMALFNADGSRAEMSGNGIRCLAQAVLRRRGEAAGTVRTRTDAGLRSVVVHPTADPTVCEADVDLGPARDGPAWTAEPPSGLRAALGVGALRAATVDVGNPHLVLLATAPRSIELDRFGPALERSFSGGINVEFIAAHGEGGDELDVAVWERGAGVTEACGTGASASAWVARRWGLVGDHVTVHLPGGDVGVRLGPTITLSGPAVHIADIEVEDPSG
jgi:diaminopimelate epimerase